MALAKFQPLPPCFRGKRRLVGFDADTLGSGKIAGSGPYEVVSGSVKVNRRGTYHLLIGTSPIERTRQSRRQRLVIQRALLKTR